MTRLMIVLLFMGSINYCFAQESTDQNIDQDRTQLKSDLEAYFQKEILPELNSSHAQLKSEMTSEDLNLLESLITQKAAFTSEHKNKRSDIKESLPEDFSREEFKAALKKRKAERSSERGSFKEDVQYLMLKYEDNIKSKLEHLKTLKESWRSDIDAIKAEHGVPADRVKRKHKASKQKSAKHGPKSKKKQKAHKKHKRLKGKKKFAMKFLLWDGGEQTAKNFSQINAFRRSSEIEIKAFPNPATDQLTIAFDLKEAQESISLELRSLDGKLIQTQKFKNLDAGPQELQLNLDGIKAGQYVYTLKGRALKASSSFVKQ